MSERNYCLSFLAACLVGALPFGLGYVYLRQSREYLSMKEVVRHQQRFGSVFGSAVFDHGPLYKLELLAARQPQIVALGSSRVLQFRQRFFNGSFVNMGRAYNLPREGKLVAERIPALARPRLVLLGVDFWWFNPRFRAADDRMLVRLAEEQYFSTKQLFLPFQWMLEEKLTLRQFLKITFGIEHDQANIGVMAHSLRQGFGPDGSYYYTGVVSGEAPRDVKFADSKKRIRAGEHIFSFGDHPDPQRMQDFLESLEKLKKSGIEVIVFSSPFSPTIYNELRKSGKHELVLNFVAELRLRGIDIVDFQDAAKTLSSTDAEFIDGFHGGDLTYAKILQRLAVRYPDSLGKLVNWPALTEVTARHRDIAFIPDPAITTKPEVDFLQLGVEKDRANSPAN